MRDTPVVLPTHPHKSGILLAAFGSTTSLGQKAIQHFEKEVKTIFPTTPVRWAFTSRRLRERLVQKKVKTDSVPKALARMHFEKFTHVTVQSLHIIHGIEYTQLQNDCLTIAEQTGLSIALGAPLLDSTHDVAKAAQALLYHLPAERLPQEAVICVGHGTWHTGKASYAALAEELTQYDNNIFIGTLEGERTVETIIPSLPKETGTVWLLPLLSVVGKHTEIDIAGATPHSWRSRLEQAGFTCRVVLKGTAEYSKFIAIWLEHLRYAQ